jgi:tRNA(His) guanylyltransferase
MITTSLLTSSKLLTKTHYANQLTCAVRGLKISSSMAQSKFEYTRKFETEDKLLPNAWIVVRIDGKAFHKFSDTHQVK